MPQTIVDLSRSDRRVVPTLEHDLILGDTTRPVASRAGVASVQALKNIIGGFVPVSLGKATVSAEVDTWRATNVVVPSTGAWFLLVSGSACRSGGPPAERRSVAAAACSFSQGARLPRPNQYRSGAVLPPVEVAATPCWSVTIRVQSGGMEDYNVEVFQL